MSLTIVPATGWGMPPINPKRISTRTLAAIVEANVHHSDSEPPANHSTCASVVRGFDAYHRNHNGWAAIGYHRVICSHGVVFCGRGLEVVPAAAEGHNTPIIAYCLIGKGDAPANAEQLAALEEMAGRDAAHVGRPLRWTTHQEVEPPGYTQCPGAGIEHQVVTLRKTHPTAQPPAGAGAAPLTHGHRDHAVELTHALDARGRALPPADRKVIEALVAAGEHALAEH